MIEHRLVTDGQTDSQHTCTLRYTYVLRGNSQCTDAGRNAGVASWTDKCPENDILNLFILQHTRTAQSPSRRSEFKLNIVELIRMLCAMPNIS